MVYPGGMKNFRNPCCAKCPKACSRAYSWQSPEMSGSLFVCSVCAHRLNNAGEVVFRKNRLMLRSPGMEALN